ncbi:glycosyltransferase [Candidatus Woesearchaeota archaeon]|nr:glycosyltransferase [Candidatus Woesearchaeota archaeon]
MNTSIGVSHSPFFSIVIATYNSFDFIEKSLQSAILQSFKNFEIIVVDDGSSLNFKNYLVSLCSKFTSVGFNIKVFFRNHDGISSTRNFGVLKSTGRYIYVLDSDDELVENSLELVFDFLVKKNYPDFIFGNILLINYNSEKIGFRRYKYFSRDVFKKKIFSSFFIPFKHSAFVYSVDAFRKLGGYNVDFLRLVDIELFFRFLNSNFVILHFSKFISKFRVHNNNFSDNRLKNLKYWFKFYNLYCSKFKILMKIRRVFIELLKYFFVLIRYKR